MNLMITLNSSTIDKMRKFTSGGIDRYRTGVSNFWKPLSGGIDGNHIWRYRTIDRYRTGDRGL